MTMRGRAQTTRRNDTELAVLVRQTRTGLGLSQAQFSTLFGVHWITVSRWERGVLEPSPYHTAFLREYSLAAARPDAYDVGRQAMQRMAAYGAPATIFYMLSMAGLCTMERGIE